MTVVTAWSVCEVQLAKLRAFHVAATAANALYPLATEGTRAGNRTILNQVSGWLTRLGPSGDLGKGVADGTFEVSRWVNVANTQAGSLATVMSGLGEDNVLSRFWSEVVIPTGKDVATHAETAAAGFGIGAGAVVALFVALKVFR